MKGLTNSVSLQIKRAIHEAIDEQVLPQNQAYLRSSSGKCPKTDGTSRLRDRHIDPKELLTVRSEAVHGMCSPEI